MLNRRQVGLAGVTLPTGASLRMTDAVAANDTAAVAQALETYRTGLLHSDKQALTALCADQLTYGHSSGKVQNKAEFIAGATDPAVKWPTITFNGTVNQMAGSNATSRFIFTGENVRDGKTSPVKFGTLIVWQKQGGKWRMLARQGYKI